MDHSILSFLYFPITCGSRRMKNEKIIGCKSFLLLTHFLPQILLNFFGNKNSSTGSNKLNPSLHGY